MTNPINSSVWKSALAQSPLGCVVILSCALIYIQIRIQSTSMNAQLEANRKDASEFRQQLISLMTKEQDRNDTRVQSLWVALSKITEGLNAHSQVTAVALARLETTLHIRPDERKPGDVEKPQIPKPITLPPPPPSKGS